MKSMEHIWGRAKAFALPGIVSSGLQWQIKDKVRSCSIMPSATNNRESHCVHPHDIAGFPWQVVGTVLFGYAGHTYFYSKYFEIELLRQNNASSITWRKYLQDLESQMKLSVTTGHNTAIPGIYLTPVTSLSRLLKSGDLVTLQAHQSIELWKLFNCASMFLSKIMTNTVEICPHLNLGTRWGFVLTGTGYGVKLKYWYSHTCCRMNMGVFTDEIEGR